MILDTTFLIDLQREFRGRKTGPARAFLEEKANIPFQISVISAAEFFEGFPDPVDGERLIGSLPWIPVDATIARKVAAYRRALRIDGLAVGDFDLIIGATAAVMNLPLVTANTQHFKRLEGLTVVSYR